MKYLIEMVLVLTFMWSFLFFSIMKSDPAKFIYYEF